MSFTAEKIFEKGLSLKFLCTLARTEINSEVETRLVDISQNVAIKGFRKGKVPAQYIRSMYFAKTFNEILNEQARHAVSDVIEKNNLALASSPRVKPFDEGAEAVEGDITFEIDFELYPTIPDLDFKKVSVQSYDVNLTEDDLNKELDLIAKRNREFSEAGDAYEAQNGDIVIIDFIGRIDGEEFEGGKATDYELELGSGVFIPGFEAQLIGSKLEENKIVSTTFPNEYHEPNLAGKEVQFYVKIKNIKQGTETKIDDNLAKKLNLSDVSQLKSDIRNKIEQYYTNAHKDNLKQTVLDEISKLLTFEVPHSILENVKHDVYRTLEAANLKKTEEERKSSDDLHEESAKEAITKLRLSYFMNHVSSNLDIQISEQDITNFVITNAANSGINPFMFLDYYNKNKEARKNLEMLLRENKVYDDIFSKISVTKSKLSKDEFDKILGKGE